MTTAIIYSEKMKDYDFGYGHPFRGDRHVNFMNLFYQKIGADKAFEIIAPIPATDEQLALVHSRQYIDFIKREESNQWGWNNIRFLDADTPLSPGMDDAARIVAGAGIMAGELVAEGRYKIAVSVGGGMHHARAYHGGGFCIYNDIAICVKNIQKKYGIKRVLIIDTDGHAGDGTSEIFYNDPNVLFISIHQDPATQYPGKGFPAEIGHEEGKGFTVNIPLPPGTAIDPYVYAMEEIFVPLAHEFKPEIILRNGGSDPHFADELIELGITVKGFHKIGSIVRETAEKVCGGKIVDMVGSGYNADVLPGSWLALVCGISGVDIDLTDPVQLPDWLDSRLGMEQVKHIVKEVKANLSPYWDCFRK